MSPYHSTSASNPAPCRSRTYTTRDFCPSQQDPPLLETLPDPTMSHGLFPSSFIAPHQHFTKRTLVAQQLISTCLPLTRSPSIQLHTSFVQSLPSIHSLTHRIIHHPYPSCQSVFAIWVPHHIFSSSFNHWFCCYNGSTCFAYLISVPSSLLHYVLYMLLSVSRWPSIWKNFWILSQIGKCRNER